MLWGSCWDIEFMLFHPNRRVRSTRRLYGAKCINMLGQLPSQTARGSKNHAIAPHFSVLTSGHIAFLFVSNHAIRPKSHDDFACPYGINCLYGRTLWDATAVAACVASNKRFRVFEHIFWRFPGNAALRASNVGVVSPANFERVRSMTAQHAMVYGCKRWNCCVFPFQPIYSSTYIVGEEPW